MIRAGRGTLASAAIVLIALGMLLVGQVSADEIVRVRTEPEVISLTFSGLGEVSFAGIGSDSSVDTAGSGITVTNLSTTLTADLTIAYEQWVIGAATPTLAVGAECNSDQNNREWTPEPSEGSPTGNANSFRVTGEVLFGTTPFVVADDEAAFVPADASTAVLDSNIAATGSATAVLDLKLETGAMSTFSCQIPMLVVGVDGTLFP